MFAKCGDDGFTDLDTVHHQAGHYIITVQGDKADIFDYAVVTQYKKEAAKGEYTSIYRQL